MVCKEDVVSWMRSLKSNRRIDVMCSLMNLCHPFELRFLGTFLEDLGKRDFQDLRQAENEANSLGELSNPELQCISNPRTRTKLAIYVSLLHSCNYTCSNSIFKTLTKEDINNVIKSNSSDEDLLEELLLIYTLALNHPAFSFEQKTALEKLYVRLQDEEKKLLDQSTGRPNQSFTGQVGPELLSEKPSSLPQPQHIQSYPGCITLEDPQLLSVAGPPTATPCPPIPSAGPHIPAEGILGVTEVGGLRLSGYPGGVLVGGGGWLASPAGMVLPATVPVSDPASTTNSPCQSNSTSRPGSPPAARKPSTPTTSAPRPLPLPLPTPSDPIRDIITKEMPTFVSLLQTCSTEQLGRMSDEELRDLGLPHNATLQLRSILNKQVPTNGIGPSVLEINNSTKKKNDSSEHETIYRRYPGFEGIPMFNVLATPGGVMCPGPALSAGCYSCFTVTGPSRANSGSKGPPIAMPPPGLPHQHPPPPTLPHHYQPPVDQLRALRIDAESRSGHGSGSSCASDSASDHSPPDTPASGLAGGAPEVSCADEKSRVQQPQSEGSGGEERRVPHGGGRPGGRGRHRNNPPGVPTAPRGRGHNPPHRREMRELSNGGVEERKMNYGSEGGFAGYPGGAPPGYMAHYLRPAAYPPPAGYPHAAHTNFVRHAYQPPFHQPNGEILYQYHQGSFVPAHPQPYSTPAPHTAPPPPTPPSAPPAPTAPPAPSAPKICCFNCGSQQHCAIDCPESTIEEITKQGQYRIDYSSSYQKPGECPSSSDK